MINLDRWKVAQYYEVHFCSLVLFFEADLAENDKYECHGRRQSHGSCLQAVILSLKYF